MEKKSIFVSVLLIIALIFSYIYFNNKIDEIQKNNSDQTSKLSSDHNQQIVNLNNEIQQLRSESAENSSIKVSDSGSTDSKDKAIASLKNEIQGLLEKYTKDHANTLDSERKSQDLLANLRSNIAELKSTIKQKDALIDTIKIDTAKTSNEQISCPEVIQDNQSCGNIAEVEMQLIEKNSQLIESQKSLSLAKSNVAILKDEKVRAKLAFEKAKQLSKSIVELENKLQLNGQKLDNALNTQSELKISVNTKDELIQDLKNKLYLSSKKLSKSESTNKLNTNKSNRELLDIKNKLLDAKADLVLSEKRVSMMKDKLAGIKQTLALYEETLSTFKKTLSQQNRLIVSNSIDRIKETEQLYGVTFAVYLAGFTEDEVENYCLTIKETTDLEVEVFGKVASLDEETQDEYRKLCSSVD
ncbi:MAG: hypothetical protein QF399_00090 [Gammaproteobacteria bacterium]|nr:hypothetical protein [Gammaproteobacteria bacterium]